MAAALDKHVLIIQYRPGKFPEKQAVNPGQDGVLISVDHIRDTDDKKEIPIKGCIDFSIVNVGSAKAYLFDGAIEILPGQTWFPQKSTPLPLINQPVLTFEGDFQLSRSLSDLIVPTPTV